MDKSALEGFAENLKVAEMLRVIPHRLMECSFLASYSAGSYIVEVGDQVKWAFFMLSGEVNVSISTVEGQISTYLIMRPPTVISDLEVLCGKNEYLASVTAGTDCKMLVCPVGPFCEELQKDVALLWQVASGASQNNHNLAYNNGQIVYRSGVEKVAYYLLHYCAEEPPHGRQAIKLEKTQGEIASELALSSKTVSRSLGWLRAKGYLSIYKKKVTIDENQYQRLRSLVLDTEM